MTANDGSSELNYPRPNRTYRGTATVGSRGLC